MNTSILRRQTAVPASAVLSAWQSHAWDEGISVDQLPAFDRLVVETRHSTYEIVMTGTGSAEVLVRGGSFFPEFTRARLAGSSLGGSFLKLRSIHVGFCMEFALEKRVIVTSPVRSVTVAPSDARSDVM
jgi:hypothetical protein